jgi:hypothetical protein
MIRALFFYPAPLWPIGNGGQIRAIRTLVELGRRCREIILLIPRVGENAPERPAAFDAEFGAACPGCTLQIVSVDMAGVLETRRTLWRRVRTLLSGRWPALDSPLILRRDAADAFAEVVAKFRPDLVIISHSRFAGLVSRVPAGTATMLELHDLWKEIISANVRLPALRRLQLGWRENQPAFVAELEAIGKFGAVSSISRRDVDSLAAGGIPRDRLFVTEGLQFRVEPVADMSRTETLDLLYVGSACDASRDALRFLLSEVAPRLTRRCRLGLVGSCSEHVQNGEVPVHPAMESVVLGRVASLEPIYRSAKLVLAPMRSPTGLNVKIAEAMALGCSVLMSATARGPSCAVAGRNCRQLPLGGPDWAAAIEELLADDPRRQAMGRAAAEAMARLAGESAAEYDRALDWALGTRPVLQR